MLNIGGSWRAACPEKNASVIRISESLDKLIKPEEVVVGTVNIHNLSIKRSGRRELGLELQAHNLGY